MSKLYRITFEFRSNICGQDFPQTPGLQTIELELNENDPIKDAWYTLERKYPGAVQAILAVDEIK